MAEVILKNVEKVYPNGYKAVHGNTLNIKDGEFMVFVGPSGCAKSTTLRMIAGLESISGGEVWIGDKLVNDLPPKERDISMVFQNYALYPHMTVYNNMAFGLQLAKVPKQEIDKRVNEAADILGITSLLKRKPKEMSGGQRQRVAVGRALVRQPKVFLFDEPLSNLDAKLRVHMRVEITKLHKHLGATMIYVTHDQVEAMTMGDRICVMESGYIRQVDTPLNLYDFPANKFVAGFIGSPSMNLLKGTLRKQDGGIFFEGEDCVLRLPPAKADRVAKYAGKSVWLGLRPEHISANPTQKNVKADNQINASVYVVEQMGHEIFVYFSPGTNQFIARLAPGVQIQSGDSCAMTCDMDKCHIFDGETEENLTN
ncbi:MAG: sn-glycerol-3-phosphate ABC transporter ATP-binding protein UgpC [Spartobacteria bacterium]|nr:sn-glycerol-3-phosphate ABC transporter ATP-binding protein UgpC [Spartobacteria bacterium]